MNDWLEPIDDDEVVPQNLPERWQRRDELYRRYGGANALTASEIAAVRAWRVGEAEDEDNKALINVARAWYP